MQIDNYKVVYCYNLKHNEWQGITVLQVEREKEERLCTVIHSDRPCMLSYGPNLVRQRYPPAPGVGDLAVALEVDVDLGHWGQVLLGRVQLFLVVELWDLAGVEVVGGKDLADDEVGVVAKTDV